VNGTSVFDGLLSILGWKCGGSKMPRWGKRPTKCPTDRRASARYPASPNEGYMGWWVGKEFRRVAVEFVDFSIGGALLLTKEVPTTRHIWICLMRPSTTPWCPVEVIRIERTEGGPVEVALHFPEPCDYDLFKAVVYGDDAKERPSCVSPEFNSRDWR
jgi:hypothetical protein